MPLAGLCDPISIHECSKLKQNASALAKITDLFPDHEEQRLDQHPLVQQYL
jgi:hypothetical protein